MKKILVLTENYPPVDGGSSRWFYELYTRLADFEVHVVTHDLEGHKEIQPYSHIKLIRINLSSTQWGIKSLTGLRFYYQTIAFVRSYVIKNNIDEIHCGRVIHEGITAWIVSSLTGVPFRCFVHGEDIETAKTSREHSFLVSRVCKNSKSLICNSDNSAKLAENLGFAARKKCFVLNPGVDTQKFFPAEVDEEFKTSMGWKNKFVLITVGRLQRRKGQDYFIKAMPKLLKQRKDLLYVIVGKGELRVELENLIKELALEQNVQMYNDLDDKQMIKFYQQCDGFILPNRTIKNDIEGFGMVLVEAQSCGKPVIAGDSGGTKETMSIGKSGYIIDCNSPESIVENLQPLIVPIENNPHSLNKIMLCQSNAREHVLKNLDWNAHVVKAREHFIYG